MPPKPARRAREPATSAPTRCTTGNQARGQSLPCGSRLLGEATHGDRPADDKRRPYFTTVFARATTASGIVTPIFAAAPGLTKRSVPVRW